MSTHNNLRPRHLPTWVGTILLCALAVAVILVQGHFQLVTGWFAVSAYIVLLFAVIVFSLRPAWGRRVFWYGACILLGLHALVGSVLLVFFPTLLHKLGSFLTVILFSDLLLTMSVLWRVAIAHRKASTSQS